MQRMTDALSRMLNDPSTRLAMRTLQNSRPELEAMAGRRPDEEGREQVEEPEAAVGEGAAADQGNQERPRSQSCDNVSNTEEAKENNDQSESRNGNGESTNEEDAEQISSAEGDIENIQESIENMREDFVERYKTYF